MASITKRGKTWQYTVSRMSNGKSKPIRKGGFKTKKEAMIAAASIETSLAKGIVPSLRLIPFSDYFKDWYTTFRKHIAEGTKGAYKVAHDNIESYFGDKPIQHITKREYQEFLNLYAETHVKHSTAKLNSRIRACVSEAIDENLITSDFTKNAEVFGKVSSKKPSEKHLDYKESETLLNVLHEKANEGYEYLILLLLLTSGIRFGEAQGLIESDFNFFNNTLTIERTWDYINGTGFAPLKNDAPARTILLDEHTMTLFKKYIKEKPVYLANTHNLIFFDPSTKFKVIANKKLNTIFRDLLKELNLKQITVHGLRHTHASILLYEGVSVYYVSERLGHGDIETTTRYYAHILSELRLRASNEAVKIMANMKSVL